MEIIKVQNSDEVALVMSAKDMSFLKELIGRHSNVSNKAVGISEEANGAARGIFEIINNGVRQNQ